MGVGERSEALPNIKAMGEKMLCPPREPGLRPPRTPPPQQPFPSAQPNFNKNSSPRLPSEAGAAPSGAAAGTQTSGTRGPAKGSALHAPHSLLCPPHPIPLRHPDPILGSQVQRKESFRERGENGAHWREGQRPKSSQTQM